MKIKKFTKISLIVAAVLACSGVLLCGVSSVMGAGLSTIRQMALNGELNRGNLHIGGNGIYFGDDDWESEVREEVAEALEFAENTDSYENDTDNYENNNHHYEGSVHHYDGNTYGYDIAGINNLDIDINAANLLFVQGESDAEIVIRLENCKTQYFECGVDGDTLEIEYETKHHYSSHNNDMTITIAIPAGASFDEIDMDMGAINAEFSLVDVSCNRLYMDMGAANVIADEFNVKELLDIAVGAGNMEIYGGTYKNIKVECGMGSLTMEGKLEGDIDADCGMGAMELRLQGDADAYNYNLSCGMGELEVNGETFGSIAGNHTMKNEGAVGTIDLDCGMGSIQLEIE